MLADGDGTPCLTARPPMAERPVTIPHGADRLVSSRPAAPRPALWDERAAERLVAAVGETAG